ncbi:MAG: four helix bundle protein [Marinilabiliaceae bacterium]|nr:four helix bundle protein [Marinilabiliaceae bacterium]
MRESSIIKDKSLKFSIRIVNLYKYLCEKNEFVMSKQILRSGTSIDANTAEASRTESESDFVHKLSIARKEGEETLYWLELLQKTDYISVEQYQSMNDDCIELQKNLTSIIKSVKSSLEVETRNS